MIWLTWRQFRTQTVVAIIALVAAAAFLVITHAQLAGLYHNSGIPSCQTFGECDTDRRDFLGHYQALRAILGIAMLAVPAVLGIFWGAPLVAREMESGTFRLAWTQSVTRGRWLVTKLLGVGLATVAVSGVLSWMVTWWFGPIDGVNLNRFSPGVFDERGIVALGYGAFAFALGVTTGVLFRRTLPAMAVTVAGFVAARLVFAQVVRPHLMSPVQHTFAITLSTVDGFGSRNGGAPTLSLAPTNVPDAWVYSTRIVDSAGHALTSEFLANSCSLPQPGKAGPVPGAPTKAPADVQQAFQDCVTKVGQVYHGVVTYQPADRYWVFQGIETAIFIGLAVVLSAFCVWWVRRRLG